MKKIISNLRKSLLKLQKRMGKYKSITLFVFIAVLIYVTLFVAEVRDLYYFSLLIIWCILIVIFNLKTTHTIGICLFLLALLFVAYISNNQVAISKTSIYLYLFLIVVLLQEWRDLLL